MVSLTPDDVARYRTGLADIPDALTALDTIEDCDGDVEDAAIVLALRAGQEPDQSDGWLAGQSKLWRVSLCRDAVQTQLLAGEVELGVRSLINETAIAPTLALPVVLYALQTGITEFCEPLTEKI